MKKINELGLSSCDLADVGGDWYELQPVVQGSRAAGVAHYTYAYNSSNYLVHKTLVDVPEGVILFVDDHLSTGLAVMGHLMLSYAFKRGVAAVVVFGKIRDVERVRAEGWPVWCRGACPAACNKRWVGDLSARWEDKVIVADDNGVVVAGMDVDVKKVAAREREWYARLAQGESTFDICCSDAINRSVSSLP